jgi:hypothetical protein
MSTGRQMKAESIEQDTEFTEDGDGLGKVTRHYKSFFGL